MPELGVPGQGKTAASVNGGLSAEGHAPIALGLAAVLIGLGALVGGALVALDGRVGPLALPGGLPPMPRETVALFLLLSGGLTTLLGALCLSKAHDL
jgi:hypothetical protein